MLGACLDAVRASVPLVHNITNYVTVNDVANVLLACGGSPIMSDEPEDVEDITALCGGLNLNIGTLNQRSIEAMHRAGKKAAALGHPILLDPVGAGSCPSPSSGATSPRSRPWPWAAARQRAWTQTWPTPSRKRPCPRPSSSQKTLPSGPRRSLPSPGPLIWSATGRSAASSATAARKWERSPAPAASPDRPLEAAAAAVATMGLAGELGWLHMAKGEGNASYRTHIIDAIYNMTGETLDKGASYELR